MPAKINNNILELQPDNIGYQAFRIPIPAPQVPNPSSMVFYYKAYLNDSITTNTTEDTTYSWNRNSFFGLSFTGVTSANTGGIVGWTNSNATQVLISGSLSNYTNFNTISPYSQIVPIRFFGNSTNLSYGSPNITTTTIMGNNAAYFCPATNSIGVSGAKTFLGILKIGKHATNAQQVTISHGTNWENLSSSNFSSALTSLSTNWTTLANTVTETTNFRSNYLNPSLSGTINFPSWIVGKWSSGIPSRKLIITDLKVEYYRDLI